MNEFTQSDSHLNLCDLLVSAGYPHLTISPERRQLAFECCLQYEVITKRITALDDMRKGLQGVKVWGNTILALLERWPDLKEKLFPRKSQNSIDLCEFTACIEFQIGDFALANKTRDYFEKYVDELNERGGK